MSTLLTKFSIIELNRPDTQIKRRMFSTIYEGIINIEGTGWSSTNLLENIDFIFSKSPVFTNSS